MFLRRRRVHYDVTVMSSEYVYCLNLKQIGIFRLDLFYDIVS